MPGRRRGWGDRYDRSGPAEVRGGIKAQSQRGSFGESWWAKRWVDVLESFDIGARLARGRSYARRGQVVSVDVAKGRVTAEVQGSRSTPYRVRIEVAPLGPEEWEKVAEALSSRAIYAAKLLAGEMPHEIESVFADAGVSLFPRKLADLRTSCTCPDAANPCKHVAAVYYLIGEEFDRDPFLIFTLRGLTRDELIGLIGAAPEAEEEGPEVVAEPEPLSADPGAFWGGAPPDGALGEVRTPPVAAALPRRLGNFPFWRGAKPLIETIEPTYARASDRALDVLAGEPPK